MSEEQQEIVIADQYRKREEAPMPIVHTDMDPMAMIAMAVRQGADIDKLDRLLVLQQRWEADQARKAFVAALAEFKAEPLTIVKDKQVKFEARGGITQYKHATLGNICDIIGARLSLFGLSYRWITEQEGKIKVTCVLMHKLGHSESVSLSAGPDESGGKNSIQAIGSCVTYLQRYTLMAITGCAAQDQDDDGARGGFTAADVMEESKLCDYLAAIEAASNKTELKTHYIAALQIAARIGDKQAVARLDKAKNDALAKVAK